MGRVVEGLRVDAAAVAVRVAEELGVERLGVHACKGRLVGFMVAIEGIDGAGLTTTSRLLVEALNTLLARGRAVYTKEPTDSPIGRLIRRVFAGLEPGLERPEVLTHLFTADRLHHLYDYPVVEGARGVVGALGAGYVVILDRYKYSNVAYQSSLGDPHSTYSVDDVLAVNALAPPAHILVYLDVEPEVALRRIRESRGRLEIVERLDRLARVREAYNKLLERLESSPEWPSKETPWESLVVYTSGVGLDCLYGVERAPVIVRVDAGLSVERVLEEALRGVLSEALRAGLITPLD